MAPTSPTCLPPASFRPCAPFPSSVPGTRKHSMRQGFEISASVPDGRGVYFESNVGKWMWRESRVAPTGWNVKRVARSNTGGPVKAEFQINDEFVFSTQVPNSAWT